MAKEKDTRKRIAVRATADGFYDGARRRKGSIFFVPEGVVGKWFEPTDPTLAALNTAALEDAAKAKKKAEDDAQAIKVKAEQDAREAKAKADADLKDAKTVADAEAKKKIFGGLLGNRESEPEVEPPASTDEPAPQGQTPAPPVEDDIA